MVPRLNLIITLIAVGVVAWMGFPAFSTCHANGGNFLSCGLVAFFIGAMKVVVFAYVLFWALLIDGIAHLIGKS